jgi:hypothetical protein
MNCFCLILGLNLYDNNLRRHAPRTYTPIHFGTAGKEQSTFVTRSNALNVTENVLQKSRTAPSLTEMYRPPSALSIPELREESLQSMLK